MYKFRFSSNYYKVLSKYMVESYRLDDPENEYKTFTIKFILTYFYY